MTKKKKNTHTINIIVLLILWNFGSFKDMNEFYSGWEDPEVNMVDINGNGGLDNSRKKTFMEKCGP